MTTHCAVKWVPGTLTADAVRLYSKTVFNFGSSQKAFLARSSFQPLVVYPVTVSPACPPDVQAFLNSHWPKRLRAYEFPAVAAGGRNVCSILVLQPLEDQLEREIKRPMFATRAAVGKDKSE